MPFTIGTRKVASPSTDDTAAWWISTSGSARFKPQCDDGLGLKRYATLCQPLQKECVHAFRRPNVDRRSHRIDKVPQQANFWFSKMRSLPRSPFQQRAICSGKRQGSASERDRPGVLVGTSSYASYCFQDP
jgi:hypothetical protein